MNTTSSNCPRCNGLLLPNGIDLKCVNCSHIDRRQASFSPKERGTEVERPAICSSAEKANTPTTSPGTPLATSPTGQRTKNLKTIIPSTGFALTVDQPIPWLSELDRLEILDLTPQFHADLKRYEELTRILHSLIPQDQSPNQKGTSVDVLALLENLQGQGEIATISEELESLKQRFDSWDSGHTEQSFHQRLQEARERIKAPAGRLTKQYAIRPDVRHKIIKESREKGSREVGQQYNIRENRWLLVDVDLTAAPPKVLANLIAKELSRARQQMTSQRDRDSSHDCWDIYRKITQEGISVEDMGRQASGENGSPNYNPRIKAAAEAHRKAFGRAQSLMALIRYPTRPTQ